MLATGISKDGDSVSALLLSPLPAARDWPAPACRLGPGQTTTRAACRKARGSLLREAIWLWARSPEMSAERSPEVLLADFRSGAGRGDEPGDNEDCKADECDCDHFRAPSAEALGSVPDL